MLLADSSLTDAVSALVQTRMSPLGLAVKTWKELNDFYANTVQLYDRQFAVLNVIILFMVALGVSNAVNMAEFERFSEFGTMRAMGNRGGSIVRLIMTESLLLGLIGAGAGVALGAGLALAISATGIPMPPPPNSNSGYTARIELVPLVFAQAAGVGLLATVVAALIPALRARRISVVDALRQAV
jgi:putative ABC transport system permease protein